MVEILMSIHSKWAELIFAELKTLELRKTKPVNAEYPIKVYLYETKGTGVGAVVGHFICPGVTSSKGFYAHLAERAKLDEAEINAYANGSWLHGFIVSEPERYPMSIPLSEFRIKTPPQSWCYVRRVT